MGPPRPARTDGVQKEFSLLYCIQTTVYRQSLSLGRDG